MEGTTKRARKGTEKRRRVEWVGKTWIVVFVDVDQGIAFAYVS